MDNSFREKLATALGLPCGATEDEILARATELAAPLPATGLLGPHVPITVEAGPLGEYLMRWRGGATSVIAGAGTLTVRWDEHGCAREHLVVPS